MSLQTIRESKNISRKELADMTGVSYRSIQDYEQGHKDIISAKVLTLYKLSVALGCTVEELIEDEIIVIDEKEPCDCCRYNELTVEEIEREKIYIEKYKMNVRWKFVDGLCYIEFMYKGELVMLPFNAVFKVKLLKFLKDAVELVVDEYVEGYLFNEEYGDMGEEMWSE